MGDNLRTPLVDQRAGEVADADDNEDFARRSTRTRAMLAMGGDVMGSAFRREKLSDARRLLFDALGGVDDGYRPPDVELAKRFARQELPHHSEEHGNGLWNLRTPIGRFTFTPDWARVSILGKKNLSSRARDRAHTAGSDSTGSHLRRTGGSSWISRRRGRSEGSGLDQNSDSGSDMRWRNRTFTGGTEASNPMSISEASEIQRAPNKEHARAYHQLNETEGIRFAEHFGLGISLYMKTLRYLSVQFFIMSLLSIPAIALYLSGRDAKQLFLRTTLAALFAEKHHLQDDTGDDGQESDDQTFLFGLSLSGASTFLAWLDVVVVSFYMISTLWLAHRQYEDSVLFDVLGTTVGDYSIMIKKLPDGATEEEVAELAERLAVEAVEAEAALHDPMHKAPDQNCSGDLAVRQAEEGHAHVEGLVVEEGKGQEGQGAVELGVEQMAAEAENDGKGVSYEHVGFVTIHYDCLDLIRGYTEQEQILRRVQEQHARVQELRNQDGVSEGDPRLCAALDRFNATADEYYVVTQQIHLASLTHPHPHPHPHRWLSDWVQKQNMAPGDHTASPAGSKLTSTRKAGAREQTANAADNTIEGVPGCGCEDVDMETLGKRRKICAFVTYRSDDTQKAVLAQKGGGKSGYDVHAGPEPDDIHFGHLETTSCEKHIRRSVSLVVTAIVLVVTAAIILVLKIWETDTRDYYEHDGESSTTADVKVNGITFLYSVMVTVLNRSLQHTLEALSLYEHRKLKSAQAAAVVWRSFLALTLNSVVVLSLVEWDLGVPFLHVYDDDGQGLITGFDEKWYEEVGSLIALTMLTNAVSQPAFTFASHMSKRMSQWVYRSKIRTQRAMNELYRGNRMVFIVRYSTVLMTVFICFGLGTSMPLLYPVASITFAMMFYSDKYCLLRLYRKPEKRFLETALLCSKVMLFAAPLHLLMSIIMLAAPLEHVDGGVAHGWCKSHSCSMAMSKLIRREVEPMVVLLLVVSGVLAVLFVMSGGKLWRVLLRTGFIYNDSLIDQEDCPSLSAASQDWANQIQSGHYEYLSTSYEYSESLPLIRRQIEYHKRNPFLRPSSEMQGNHPGLGKRELEGE